MDHKTGARLLLRTTTTKSAIKKMNSLSTPKTKWRCSPATLSLTRLYFIVSFSSGRPRALHSRRISPLTTQNDSTISQSSTYFTAICACFLRLKIKCHFKICFLLFMKRAPAKEWREGTRIVIKSRTEIHQHLSVAAESRKFTAL